MRALAVLWLVLVMSTGAVARAEECNESLAKIEALIEQAHNKYLEGRIEEARVLLEQARSLPAPVPKKTDSCVGHKYQLARLERLTCRLDTASRFFSELISPGGSQQDNMHYQEGRDWVDTRAVQWFGAGTVLCTGGSTSGDYDAWCVTKIDTPRNVELPAVKCVLVSIAKEPTNSVTDEIQKAAADETQPAVDRENAVHNETPKAVAPVDRQPGAASARLYVAVAGAAIAVASLGLWLRAEGLTEGLKQDCSDSSGCSNEHYDEQREKIHRLDIGFNVMLASGLSVAAIGGVFYGLSWRRSP